MWAALGARARCTILHCCFLFFFGGGVFWGGGPGGLIMFLAGRLTRYSLGLAATLSTLLLHCTLSHAINFFFNLQDTLDFCIVVSCFFLGGFGGEANNVLGWPSYNIFSWTCCYAIHSSLALYLATRYQLSGGLRTFLAGRLTRYSLGLAATLSTLLLHCTLKIADIRKERWPSQNEPRCAINDPAMDVAPNNFAVFSKRIDVTPCRSDEETS